MNRDVGMNRGLGIKEGGQDSWNEGRCVAVNGNDTDNKITICMYRVNGGTGGSTQ